MSWWISALNRNSNSCILTVITSKYITNTPNKNFKSKNKENNR